MDNPFKYEVRALSTQQNFRRCEHQLLESQTRYVFRMVEGSWKWYASISSVLRVTKLETLRGLALLLIRWEREFFE